MGYRTVVILYNDQAYEWENDPNLGRKIAQGMNRVGRPEAELLYGHVVECAHADTETLARLSSYGFHPITHGFWSRGRTEEELTLSLLREAADKLGYRLTKKASPQPRKRKQRLSRAEPTAPTTHFSDREPRRQEHDVIMRAIGHEPEGDGSEHGSIMREITGHG